MTSFYKLRTNKSILLCFQKQRRIFRIVKSDTVSAFISIYEFKRDNAHDHINTANIVMEYLEGVTLKAYLDRKKRLTPPEETPTYTGSHEPEKSKKRSKKGFIIALAPEAAVIAPTVTLVFVFDIFKTSATVLLFRFSEIPARAKARRPEPQKT